MLRRSRHMLLAVATLALAVLLSGMHGLNAPSAPVHGAFGRGPTIALVHGLGSRAEHWLPAARLLARHYRVVVIELPGHRDSAMPEPFSLERATEALDRALAAEGRDPVFLVGHSIGGLVAVSEALAHPHRVRGLVLVETALKPQVAREQRDSLLADLDHDYQGVLRSAYLAFGRDSVQGAALYQEVAALDSLQIKRWIRLALSADLSVPAARLVVPVLAILAERSWPVDESWQASAEALGYGRIPRVRPARVDRCGHFVMLDQPEAVARLIENFVSHPDGSLIAVR